MRRVLVTGAGGYIGAVLTPLLLQHGYAVTAVDRFFFGRQTLPPDGPALRVVRDDIRWVHPGIFEEVYAVVDLAALSNDPAGELDPERTWEINHHGRVRIATLARQTGVERYILPSSCSVYGFRDDWIDESSAPQPLTTYAKANLRAEEDILALADRQFCAVVIRQATVYGLSPRMRFDLAINGMVGGLYRTGKIPILRDGSQWRPFVHVRDAARALILMLEASKQTINAGVFNVGSDDQNFQILPLAQMVAEAIQVPFAHEWYGAPDHRSYRVSFRKISQALGFAPQHTPQDGAREVYEALCTGAVHGDDPRTITVQWYKHLLEMQQLLRDVEMDGILL